MPSNKKLLQAAAGSAGGGPLYVEDVFSTFLYTGNATARSFINGVDLSGEGGLVWGKWRGGPTGYTGVSHELVDTERGVGNFLRTNTTGDQAYSSTILTAFNSNGFSIGTGAWNLNNEDYVSWSFRKAEKFFDVVTYTGTGVARTIAHNLGSVPGSIIIKRTDTTGNWYIYHIGIATPQGKEILFTTGQADTNTNVWNNTVPTDSVFSIGAGGSPADWNASGGTYVAYLFASDAGGFGDDGDENIIKCGSYAGNGVADGPEVSLGWEPQYLLIKASSRASGWYIQDTMRGIPTGGANAKVQAQETNAEAVSTANMNCDVTADGFKITSSSVISNGSGQTYIYIAIRRPMKTPEAGTEVFTPIAHAGTGSITSYTGVGFSPDAVFSKNKTGANRFSNSTRLRGTPNLLFTSGSNLAEDTTHVDTITSYNMDGISLGADGYYSTVNANAPYIQYHFKRAPGFFDVVCYTGNATVGNTFTHNLGVVPEFIIAKNRDAATGWICYHKGLNGGTSPANYYILLNLTSAEGAASSVWNNTAPTSTTVTLGNDNSANGNGNDTIAYLFASVAGVSKVGSYTGTGADLNVDCGFTGGARFILIKRTDSTGDWYVYDSVSGISAGNDPYVLLNSSLAQVTNTDYIDPLNAGFTVTSSAPAGLNASSGTYIFLAIA